MTNFVFPIRDHLCSMYAKFSETHVRNFSENFAYLLNEGSLVHVTKRRGVIGGYARESNKGASKILPFFVRKAQS